MTGWMKTPLGTDPGHIVLEGGPSSPPCKKDAAAPLFSADVYCGHGRPSPLLLSSCIIRVCHFSDVCKNVKKRFCTSMRSRTTLALWLMDVHLYCHCRHCKGRVTIRFATDTSGLIASTSCNLYRAVLDNLGSDRLAKGQKLLTIY